jgi:hypothetical protein
LAEELGALEAREQQVAETIWANELLAQQCGQRFERFWDALNRAPDKWAVVASFDFEELHPGTRAAPESLPHELNGTSQFPTPPGLRGTGKTGWNGSERCKPPAGNSARSNFGTINSMSTHAGNLAGACSTSPHS